VAIGKLGYIAMVAWVAGAKQELRLMDPIDESLDEQVQHRGWKETLSWEWLVESGGWYE
jgi:hypothetical protein